MNFSTPTKEFPVTRSNFNRDLIVGLWKCRHKRPELRPWLRQCITLEKSKRGGESS